MATAADTYTWADKKASIRVYCGLAADDTTEDTNLEMWLDSACAECDEFMRRDPDDWTHSAAVWNGILEYVRTIRLHYRRGDTAGITQKKTGALSESYGPSGSSPGGQLALTAARPHWQRDARTIWLQGARG